MSEVSGTKLQLSLVTGLQSRRFDFSLGDMNDMDDYNQNVRIEKYRNFKGLDDKYGIALMYELGLHPHYDENGCYAAEIHSGRIDRIRGWIKHFRDRLFTDLYQFGTNRPKEEQVTEEDWRKSLGLDSTTGDAD